MLAGVLFCASCAGATTGPGPQAQMSTPKGCLHYADKVALEAGADKDLQFYYWSNDQEEKVARAMAQNDLAMGQLEKSIRARYDEQTVVTLLHAMRNETGSDIDDAQESINGDQAVIKWKDGQPPLAMVRVDGEWKVSVSGLMNDNTPDDCVEVFNKLSAAVTRLTAELNDGKFANAPLLERAIQRAMEKWLGAQ
jgi:hypothetical protein